MSDLEEIIQILDYEYKEIHQRWMEASEQGRAKDILNGQGIAISKIISLLRRKIKNE